MSSFRCLGLPADWVNAWLAAVGTTVLDCRIRLHWTDDPVPLAVLSAKDTDPVDILADAWPTQRKIEDMPLAEEWMGAGRVPRKVPVDDFVARVRAARGDPFSWTLSSTLTDLSVDKSGEVAHGPFDPPMPRGVTLHRRLLKVYEGVEAVEADFLRNSFLGYGRRFRGNGLGFDLTRLASSADATDPWTEPVVETLTFFGLAVLPVRGSGTDARLGSSRRTDRQRGWSKRPKSRPRRFRWPTWSQPLNADGIDALMDMWDPMNRVTSESCGVRSCWEIVPYRPKSPSDATRGFGSRQLW